MLRHIAGTGPTYGIGAPTSLGEAIAPAGGLDGLIALERIGARQSFNRNQEIYAEGDPCKTWYKVISGTVRISKLLADGRRHIAEFYFSGDCFGLEDASERLFGAEAVSDVIVMRFSRRATEEIADETPALSRLLREIMLRDLATAHGRMLLLSRMDAPQRVANFLLEMAERRASDKGFDLPMSRNDIADYLGLTIETVCRVLSTFKRERVIAIPQPHRIELRDRPALEAIAEV